MPFVKNAYPVKLSPFFSGALFILIFFCQTCLHAHHNHFNSSVFDEMYLTTNTAKHCAILSTTLSHHNFPNPLRKLLKRTKNHYIAAALAFPFPFGGVGLHRVYLGTAAHVPIVYAASAGGVFGLLPLMDCIVLLSNTDISKYENNPQVIMWIKHSSASSHNTNSNEHKLNPTETQQK